MDPVLTYSLPPRQTACGIVDILMHTMERYFSHQSMALTLELAEALMRTVIAKAKVLTEQPRDYDARAEIMWAGSLSHNGLFSCGTEGGDWAAHQLEHELGGMFDVAHGAGLAAVWGSWARYVYRENVARFVGFATHVFGICKDSDEETALAGIQAMEEFYHSIQMPTTISELGIELTEEQIETLAYKCSFENKRTIGTIKKLDTQDMENIFRLAR